MPLLLRHRLLPVWAKPASQPVCFRFAALKMLKFAEMFGATDGSDETFANLLQLSFPAPAFVSRAFEENRLFVYAAAEIPQAGPGNGSQVGAERPFHLTRRLIFLKPSTFL